MVIINWCSWQCFGLTCNYEESWDRPVMRWNVREKSWQLIVPLLAPQDYSQKTATTVTFRWFKNHESPVRLIKIKQSLIYLVIFRNLKCLHFLLEPFGSEGIGMKTTAFQNLLLNISYFLIMGKVGMKVSSNYWLSECIRSKVILRENVMILSNFMDFQNQFRKMDEEVYI